ncbi:myotubularin-related protein 3 isoform X1 [Tribolium madens]|uniref:myotubularin-related protein 3 isoform X1 n=2 Tax=Tribolium madens TaxID=41895 RepID=UPI001CF73442|nr:myotubularin-related protein 3 isoform X1 [Tribolium madens]
MTGDESRVMDTTDQPNSICHVQPIQMYPLPPLEPSVSLPFKLLAGEAIFHHGKTVDGLIVLTNYRLYLQLGDSHHHLPLGLIESVEHRELFYLHIGCKDARTYRCIFGNNESCMEWFERISKAGEPPRQLEQIFAFYHFIWAKDKGGEEIDDKIRNLKRYTFDYKLFKEEMERLQFEGDSWRISDANKNYKLCPTYPPYLIVPSCINDETLECVAKFRSSRRIPAVVWRHTKNGAVIARCSQPEVGWLGWRSSEDEDLIKAISQACNFDQRNDKESILSHSPGSLHSEDSLQITTDLSTKEKKVLIMDARSYTTAVANRARGGGCECPEYYPNCEIQFMNLANIHSIRKSFNALRLLCTSSADQPNWFSQLEGTRWLQHMSGLMKAAVTLVNAVEREARPVLVHCSDGWDRTPQIVALAELLLDPHYRTMDGFRILIEREWLAFGHKFADRCGHSSNDDPNERCPVFLQWLDCVHQLLQQFSCAFEFSQSYLVKLAQHVYSNIYGTFLCNTFQERMKVVNGKTFSVWEFLNSPRFKNHLYASPGNSCGNKVLWPQCNVRDLQLWREVYLGSWESNFSTDGGSGSCPGPPETSPSHMTKTRSYGDLINAADVCPNQFRRSSDPSINIDKKLSVMSQENAPTQDIVKQGDFLCNDTDEVECNKDCIYKDDKPTFKILNGSAGVRDGDFLTDHVINGDKTDNIVDDCEDDVRGVCLHEFLTPSHNHNNEVDSDNELTEKSENTLCEKLETSTDTLVSDNHNISSSPLEVNGFEKLQSPDLPDGYPPKLNAQLSLVNCISPMYSRTSSSSGWDTPHKPWHQPPYSLGDDGLVPVTSAAQERLWQIIQEHKRKEEQLEKELHTYRQALLRQSCHRCNNNDEKLDDASDSESEASNRSPHRISSPVSNKASSVVESVCSAGEGQASAVESLRSDMSWEALEENSILTECTTTLWVPDHAVSRCTGCQTEFWVGKRKHHCRKCGRIFCASCSENSTPLPSEQLYNPVRVCTGCFSKLRRDCGEVPDQCKHSNGQPTNSNPQITASSN